MPTIRQSQTRFTIQRNAEIRLAKTSAMIIGVYIICWSPTLIKFCRAVFSTPDKNDDSGPESLTTHIARDISNLAAHFNRWIFRGFLHMLFVIIYSALNPIIYAYRIKRIRDGVKKLLKLDNCAETEFSEDQRSPEPTDQSWWEFWIKKYLLSCNMAAA